MSQLDVEVALAAAAAGATIVRNMHGAELSHLEKSATDFATEADLAAEEAIRSVIAAADAATHRRVVELSRPHLDRLA